MSKLTDASFDNAEIPDEGTVVKKSVMRLGLDTNGVPCFVEVFPIGKCNICGEIFYDGDEERMKYHNQEGTEPAFSNGEILNILIPFIKGPHRCGTVLKGQVIIVKVLKAGDYFNCLHQYLIDVQDEGKKRSLVDWMGMTMGEEIEEMIESETDMTFDQFMAKWDANEIRTIDLPDSILDHLLTLEERTLQYWQTEFEIEEESIVDTYNGDE